MQRFKYALGALVITAGQLVGMNSHAQDDDVSCSGGQGNECLNTSQCVNNELATACVFGDDGATARCQIPCEDEDGNRLPEACSLGETCIEGETDVGPRFYCKSSAFAMDLNLLDTCIYYFLENQPIFFNSNDTCSLQRNLSKMLDRNDDDRFNIFDVDQCINDFLDGNKTENACECASTPAGDTSLYEQVHNGTDCYEDADCGSTPCTYDMDCGEGGVCDLEDDTCKCLTPPCDWQIVCDTDINKCRKPCTYNIDCEGGQICDDSYMCRHFCEVDAQCGEGQVCNLEANLCTCDEWECPDSDIVRVYCATDHDCGRGLFCNEDMHYCERECGAIVNRSSPQSSQKIMRNCFGNLKTCQIPRGKCVDVDMEGRTCNVDSDCPKGAYCFVGECQPLCFSSIQCPDSQWYCSATNHCMPKPLPTEDESEVPFDPMDYSLLLAERQVSLDTLNDEYKIPLLMMNIVTRKQVFDEPNVVFGYRMEIKYEMKQDSKCLVDFDYLYQDEVEICEENQNQDILETCLAEIQLKKEELLEDCLISPDEEFITIENPFGTVYGTGDPTMDIRLNYGAVEELTPGFYQAKLTVFFNNGNKDSTTITFQKESPNGEYSGALTVYKGGLENRLMDTNVDMRVYIREQDDMVRWDDFINENNLGKEKEFIDITRGYPVVAYLDGDASLMFNNPQAIGDIENEIPLKGIFSPDTNRMRLVGVIDVGEDYCVSEDGECDENRVHQLKTKNIFGRKIRRIIEFIGTFNYRTGRFGGDPQSAYRETISGLLPANTDITLEGLFELRKKRQDDTPLENDEPLAPVEETVGFKNRFELMDTINQEVEESCAGFFEDNNENGIWDADEISVISLFEDKDKYRDYVNRVDSPYTDFPRERIFDQMINFEGEIGRALDDLENNQEDYLTLSEYLKGTILFCDTGGVADESCIDERKIRCGLALYRKAMVSMAPPDEPPVTEYCTVDGNCSENLECDTHTGECICFDDSDCACIETEGCQSSCAANSDCSEIDSELVCDSETNQCRCISGSADCRCCPEKKVCNPDGNFCQNVRDAWVDLGSFDITEDFSSFTLFCPEVALEHTDCTVTPIENPALFALHEHSRFYKELVQTLSYQAGSELSDAFYTMYKAFQGDALDEDTAAKYKEVKLYAALENYDGIRHEAFSPVASAIMYQWPMRYFASRGGSWMKYLQTAAKDRMNTMLDLVDLKRRVFMDTNQNDYIFVQHLMQEEYLTQVYLYLLQEHWQGELFQYAGAARDIMDQGTALLAKVNENRNPLGYHPRMIYFENSDLNLTNWQNYKRRVEDKLVKAEQAVSDAIENMRNALRDRDNLEVSLMQAAHSLDAQMDAMCGEEEPPVTDICSDLVQPTTGEFLDRNCDPEEADCLFEWNCEGYGGENDCSNVVSTFKGAVDNAEINACRVDDREVYIDDVNGNQLRLCIRGQMGGLIQQGILLDMQRNEVVKKVQTLVRQIAREHTLFNEVHTAKKEQLETLKQQMVLVHQLESAFSAAEVVWEVVHMAQDLIMCEPPATLAGDPGTCIQAAAATAATVSAQGTFKAAKTALLGAVQQLQQVTQIVQQQKDLDLEEKQFLKSMDDMISQVENHVFEYELLYQQSVNNEIQILDLEWLAQRTIQRYHETLSSLIDRLIGRETGSVLLATDKIIEAEARFDDTLLDSYKMAQAFVYRYNYGQGAEQMANQVYQLMTVDDIRDFTEELTQIETEYCGAAGLDCDFKNNQKVFRLSLRDALFPNLQDEVVGDKVLTKGQKFHNAITSSTYVRKRQRASGVRRQIELPIYIWMSKGGGVQGEGGYMVNPEECNHFIVGQRNNGSASAGTIAANVIGTRLPQDIQYELWRGESDQIRDCELTDKPNEYSVNFYTVGWAPQSSFADTDDPLDFLTHSQSFSSCQNNWRLEDPNLRNNEDSCFNYFARGRSLGTLDSTFVIPFVDEEQDWVYGEGLPGNEQPIIEDIILYFRYNSQPIYSDGL